MCRTVFTSQAAKTLSMSPTDSIGLISDKIGTPARDPEAPAVNVASLKGAFDFSRLRVGNGYVADWVSILYAPV